MGEAKRRKKLDPNFGKIRKNPNNAQLNLNKFQEYMDKPLSEYANPENDALFSEGIEELFLMAKQAGVNLPSLPDDPKERQILLDRIKQEAIKYKI